MLHASNWKSGSNSIPSQVHTSIGASAAAVPSESQKSNGSNMSTQIGTYDHRWSFATVKGSNSGMIFAVATLQTRVKDENRYLATKAMINDCSNETFIDASFADRLNRSGPSLSLSLSSLSRANNKGPILEVEENSEVANLENSCLDAFDWC